MKKSITWLGHASIKLQDKDKVIYIDPFQLSEDNYEPVDIILVTHHHGDHYSPEDIKKIMKPETVIIAPEICRDTMTEDFKLITIGETIIEQGVKIEAVPAYNINKEFHPKSAGIVGYIVTVNGKRVYDAGDTDFIPEMLNIDVDVAFLPVGGTYTMDPEAAAKCADALKTKLVIPFHYGAGIIGTIKDAEKFKKLSTKEVTILKPGESL
jgi:L-ascorbate metabolism protein UlaG (beta-lactamase superfamily)